MPSHRKRDSVGIGTRFIEGGIPKNFSLYTPENYNDCSPRCTMFRRHALLHIVSDPHTITSQVLAMYHFDAQAIATELQR